MYGHFRLFRNQGCDKKNGYRGFSMHFGGKERRWRREEDDVIQQNQQYILDVDIKFRHVQSHFLFEDLLLKIKINLALPA